MKNSNVSEDMLLNIEQKKVNPFAKNQRIGTLDKTEIQTKIKPPRFPDSVRKVYVTFF